LMRSGIAVLVMGVAAAFAGAQSSSQSSSPASSQPSSTGLGLGSGSGYVPGTGSVPPTLPYRDPWLDPAYQTDYEEPLRVLGWESPGEAWQIGVPVRYRGAYLYVVRDAAAYIEQFDPAVQVFLVAHPAAQTGLLVDLVEDSRGPVTGVLQYNTSAYGTGFRMGEYEFSRRDWPNFNSGLYSSSWDLGWYGGLGPDYWYWLDQSPEELRRLWRYRIGHRGLIEGQYVPGYSPIVPEPEPVVLPTPRELGVAALAAGETGEAVVLLLEHLNSDAGTGDWAARRLLAVALVGERKTSDAATLMRLAYLGEPSLAFAPLAEDFGAEEMPSGINLRVMAGEAGRFANRADSASGWFLLAVVLRAQGHEARALELLDRAERWQLEPEILLEMRAAMGR
jgi:hypothetical protein